MQKTILEPKVKQLNKTFTQLWVRTMFALWLIFILFDACKQDIPIGSSLENEAIINLKWNKAYLEETKEKVETGLMWVCCFLGAELPEGSFQNAIHWNENTIEINFKNLGFNQQAVNAIEQLIKLLKNSEEYQVNQSVDMGRFIMLTLNSSKHYYAITGAKSNYALFMEDKVADPKKAAIIESAIDLGNRLINVPDSQNQSNNHIFFAAEECDGKIVDGTQKVFEYEVTDLMSNGQFRFAIYDSSGILQTASNALKTISGKPSKCLWCHEILIQPPFIAKTAVDGYYSPDEFRNIVIKNTALLGSFRNTKKSDIDYKNTQDHTYAELLYISFMEPTLERIANEWNLSIEKTSGILSKLDTHKNKEFIFSDSLYDRSDIDRLSPFKGLRVPDSAREAGEYEPDLIH